MFVVVASLLIANEPYEKFEWYDSVSEPLLATTRKDAVHSPQSLLNLQGQPTAPLDSEEQSADSMFEYDDTQNSENEAVMTEQKISHEETEANLEVSQSYAITRFFCGQNDAERPPAYKFWTYFIEATLF